MQSLQQKLIRVGGSWFPFYLVCPFTLLVLVLVLFLLFFSVLLLLLFAKVKYLIFLTISHLGKS